MNNNMNRQTAYDTDDIGLTFANLLNIFRRNFLILLSSIFLLSSAGIVYHAYMVDDPTTEQFQQVNASVYLRVNQLATNNQRTLIQIIDQHSIHNTVVAIVNADATLPNITAAQLRNGMVRTQEEGQFLIRLTIRATPDSCRNNPDTVSRNRIPAGEDNARVINAVLEVFVEELIRHVRSNNSLNHLSTLRVDGAHPITGQNGWRLAAVNGNPQNVTSTVYPESISMLMFLLIGMAIGAFGAVTKELMSDRVYDYETIEKKYNTKIIGMLPNYRK